MLSLLLHALLLLISFRHTAPPRVVDSLRIDLLQPTPPIETPVAEVTPAAPPAPAEPAPPIDPPEVATEPPETAPVIEQAVPEEPETRRPDATRLRAQIIAGIHQREAATLSEDNRAARPAAVPRIPDAPGWLNDHVGAVQPSMEAWNNPDGSADSRQVLADGTVICGRLPPPTSADIHGFDIRVFMYTVCGRERPAPIDRSDPWQRGGGRP